MARVPRCSIAVIRMTRHELTISGRTISRLAASTSSRHVEPTQNQRKMRRNSRPIDAVSEVAGPRAPDVPAPARAGVGAVRA